jgi:hypothetical protein
MLSRQWLSNFFSSRHTKQWKKMAAHLNLETSQKDLEKELYFTNSIQIPLIIPQGVVKVMIKKIGGKLGRRS